MCTCPKPGSRKPVPGPYRCGVHVGSLPSYTVRVPWVTTMKAGPGCECQPVEPPGLIVVVRTTVSVGAFEKILKSGELSWYGPRLIRPSVVLVAPEGGVAHATPASVNGARNRTPARMMTMRFMCVQSLLWLFLDRRLRCVPRRGIGLLPVRSQQREGHVEHARGGAGEGELAARAGVGAGPAGDRMHDG